MSVYAHSQCAKLFSGDENGLRGFQSSLSQKQASQLVVQGLVAEVGYALGDSLHIPGAQEFYCASDGNGRGSTKESVTSGECKLQQANLAKKCLSKSLTFPASVKMKSNLTSPKKEDDLFEDFGTVLNKIFSEESNSLPRLSAMKGSREKSGGSPRKLTVKWAPDVYDPTPTIVSHTVVRGRKQQKSRKDKKNGKDKRKGGGNSSRGTNGKDKKQYRKSGGSPNKCYKSLEDVQENRVHNEFHDFDPDAYDVHSPDSYCGSSFLKKSPNKVHFSLAEAS